MQISTNLIRINHKNNLQKFDSESLIQSKQQLYFQLAQVGENNNVEILAYVESLLPGIMTDDVIVNSVNLSKGLLHKAPKQKRLSKLDIQDLIEKIDEKSLLNNVLVIDENFGNTLSNILMNCFVDLEQSYKIKTFKQFEEKLEESRFEFYDFSNNRTSCSTFLNTTNSTENCTNASIAENTFLLQDLQQLFEIVKTLKLSVPKIDVDYRRIVLILMNMSWLFPNLLEIDLDLESESHKISSQGYFSQKSISSETFEAVTTHKSTYDTLIMLPYFIAGFNNLTNLKINLPRCYQTEFDLLLKSQKILSSNLHILDLVDMITGLVQFEIAFNSLCSPTFQRVLSMIHKNNNLKVLTLDLFPNSEDLFTKSNLLNLTQLYDANINRNRYMGNTFDEADLFLDELLPNFEANLEYLIEIMSQKSYNLNKIEIAFDIPTILFSHDKFILVLHKFLLNLLILIHNPESKIEDVVIKSLNMPFDSRKFPNLNSFIEGFNSSNKTFKNLTLNLRFNNIYSLSSIFSPMTQFLELSNVDPQTLKALTKVFKKGSTLTNLRSLNISLDSLSFHSNNMDVLFDFMRSIQNTNLTEVQLASSLVLNSEHISCMFNIMKADGVQNYKLRFRKDENCQVSHGILKSRCFYKVTSYKLIPLLFCLAKRNVVGSSLATTLQDCVTTIILKDIDIGLI